MASKNCGCSVPQHLGELSPAASLHLLALSLSPNRLAPGAPVAALEARGAIRPMNISRSHPRPSPRRGLRSLQARTRALGLLLLTSLVACGQDEPPSRPSIDESSARELSVGKLVGFTSEDGAHVWRGIPFAQPPIGDLRWRAPRSAKAWAGTLEALEFGSPCIQYAGPAGRSEGLEDSDTLGSEDCLTLNVFAPPSTPENAPTGSHRLPVMLWIHGGGNSIGSALLYDASRLAVSQDVIVVTIHYRLGVFGWFAHDAVAGANATAEDQSGNFGTLDTIAALEWVQEHISDFGGDPERVTVFGESAGGSDTFAMLVSPRAAGLFHRAIVQSGSGDLIKLEAAQNWIDDTESGHVHSSNEVLLALLLADGTAADRDTGRQTITSWTPTQVSDYLRGKTPTELLSLYGGGFGGMYDTPKLIRDGVVLPKLDPRESFSLGAYNAVPVIFGTNRDEVKLFAAFGSKDVARIGIIPLWFKNERMYHLTAEYGTKFWKARGVDEAAAAITSAGRAPAFAYRFDWDEEGKMLWFDLSPLLGAAHAFEIPFVFGGLAFGPVTDNIFPESSRPAARILSDQMMSYWGQFAYTGDPGRGRDGNLPQWKNWGADPGQFLIFDTPADGGLRLSAETLTTQTVLEQIANDDRFETSKERCTVYWDIYRFNGRLSLEEFKTIDGGICKDFEGA
ncbi:MAG: carboxylesterase family protein [Myxococcales bacterium]